MFDSLSLAGPAHHPPIVGVIDGACVGLDSYFMRPAEQVDRMAGNAAVKGSGFRLCEEGSLCLQYPIMENQVTIGQIAVDSL